MNQIQVQAAVKAMTDWLAHPQELGRPPAKIECAGTFSLHELRYYMFKYKKTPLDQWRLGVCGGYAEEETEHCGHVFSKMEPYCEADAQEKSVALVEEIRAYWMEQAERAEERKENAGTMLAFVLLEKPFFDKAGFLREMRETWQIEDTPGEERGEDCAETAFISYKGSMLAVSLMPGPVPEDEAVFHAQKNYMWTEGAEIVRGHRAHLMVAVLGQPDSGRRPLDNGTLLVKAVTACCRQKGVLGIYANDVVYQPELYTDLASLLQEGALPLFNLVWFGLYRSENGFCGYTSGMRALGYEEMEVLDADAQPADIREFLSDIALYVVEEDVVLEDGETIGFSAEQKLPITKSRGAAVEGNTLKIGFPVG